MLCMPLLYPATSPGIGGLRMACLHVLRAPWLLMDVPPPGELQMPAGTHQTLLPCLQLDPALAVWL